MKCKHRRFDIRTKKEIPYTIRGQLRQFILKCVDCGKYVQMNINELETIKNE